MTPYSLRHLSDQVLLRDFEGMVSKDRATTAALLAHIAEVDARRLYCAAGYPSMYLWCVQAFGMSEDAAFNRIRAARTAREFPAIFAAIAEGRLNLTAVLRLAPFLTADTADELLASAAGKCKAEIEQLLAERFPRPDVPTLVEPLLSCAGQPPVPAIHSFRNESIATISPTASDLPAPRARVAPLAPERFALQVTLDRPTHDLLREVQDLLGHQVAPGNVAEVLHRALHALRRELEKGKFSATDRPRAQRRASRNPRHIPAAVKREVWERDGGQCTFVGSTGHRCQSRTRLEFDHVEEVARGGKSVASNLRLLCRAHNQYGAERTFGAGFMDHQRREAAEARALARARTAEDGERQDLARALRGQPPGQNHGASRRSSGPSDSPAPLR